MISGEWTAGVKAAAMTVDGMATEDAISAIVYTDDLNGDSEYVKIGSTAAAHIQVTVKQPSMTYADKQIAVSIGGVPLGVFTVVSVESGDGQCVLEGYDAMGTAMETAYYPSSGTMTALAVLREICDKSGVELGDVSGITDVTVSGLGIGMTCREMAGYMAALLGRNAHIDRNGALALRWYEDTGYAVTADDYYAGGLTKNDGDFTIGKIECSVTTVVSETDESGSVTTETNSTETLTAGSGDTGISIECDLMTQDILDGIYERIGSFTFRPMVIRFFGDVRVETGDLITVIDLSGSSYTVPVMQVEHSWDGGVTTTVTAVGTTASAGSYTGGALSQAVSRLTAELGIYVNLEAQNIAAVNAKITTLTAEVAEVEELVAEKASIEELDAVKATIDDLDVSELTARVADIESAYITTADVETLLAEKAYITTADVETLLVEKAYITSADVDTLLATKAYITTADVETLLAEKAYITTADVDTLLATKAYITTGDVETLLAEKAYITSAEVTTLLADYASVDDLTAAVARIGTIEADYITTGTLETEILSLTTLLANYALVDDLDAVNAVIENLDAKYATIDLLNVTEQAYIEDLLVRGGILTTDLTGVTISATKYLTGVTIVGDVIQAGTLTADKLVLTGADGLIYEINATSGGLTVSELEDEVYQSYIDGSVLVAESVTADQIAAGTITGDKIAANTITADNILAATITSLEIAAGAIETENLATASVTAEKIYVTDLYALGATIGGWTIGETAIYSGTDAMDSTVAGTYIGLDGIRQYASENAWVTIEDGTLTANGAVVYGSITSTYGFYYSSLLDGRVYVGEVGDEGDTVLSWYGRAAWDPTADEVTYGTAVVLDLDASPFFGIGYQAADSITYGYVLNNGLNPDGYTEQNIFYGTTRFDTAAYMTSNLVFANGHGVMGYSSSGGAYWMLSIASGGSSIYAGSSSSVVYLRGTQVYLRTYVDSTAYSCLYTTTAGILYVGSTSFATYVRGSTLYLGSTSYATYVRGSSITVTGDVTTSGTLTTGGKLTVSSSYVDVPTAGIALANNYGVHHYRYNSTSFVKLEYMDESDQFILGSEDYPTYIYGTTLRIAGNGSSAQWVYGRDYALLRSTTCGSTAYSPILSAKCATGSWELGPYSNNSGDMYLTYITDTNYNAGTNTQTAYYRFGVSGHITISVGGIRLTNGYGVYALPSSGGSTYYRLIQMGTDNYVHVGTGTYTTVVYGGPLYLNTNSYATYLRGSAIYMTNGMYITNQKYLYWYNTSGTACTMMVFGSGNALYVGNGSYVTYLHGSSIYTNVATSVSSDERLKQDWTSLDKYEGFFDGLRPMAYRLTDDPLQYHMGMSAQAVEQALTDCSLEPDDFAGLSKHTVDPDNDVWHGYEEEYALAYSEFVPLLIDQVQKLKSRVAALENN